MASLALLDQPAPVWSGDLSTFVTVIVPQRPGHTDGAAHLNRLTQRLFRDFTVTTRGVHEVCTRTEHGMVSEVMSTHVVSLLTDQGLASDVVMPLSAIPTVIATFLERLQVRTVGYTVDALPVQVRRSMKPWQDFGAGQGPRVLVRSKPLPVRPRLRFPLPRLGEARPVPA